MMSLPFPIDSFVIFSLIYTNSLYALNTDPILVVSGKYLPMCNLYFHFLRGVFWWMYVLNFAILDYRTFLWLDFMKNLKYQLHRDKNITLYL